MTTMDDAHKLLQITLNPDGSITRHRDDPRVPPTGDQLPPDSTDRALSKDITLNESHGTFIRIFRPIITAPASNLPVILYIHGGAFILSSAAAIIFQKPCSEMAAELPALVLSIEHRLAPEHRLPAAYDDALEALLWVRDQARSTTEPWLDWADFSRCYVMGNSSGANIALHLTLRAMEVDVTPLKLVGMVLYQPGFAGEERTESELRMQNDKVLPLHMMDLVSRLCLPEGADRDHEYLNPMKLKGRLGGLPRCLVRGYLGDPMIDRQRAFAELMEEEGVTVVKSLDVEGYHAIDFFDADLAAALLDDVKRFVNAASASSTVS